MEMISSFNGFDVGSSCTLLLLEWRVMIGLTIGESFSPSIDRNSIPSAEVIVLQTTFFCLFNYLSGLLAFPLRAERSDVCCRSNGGLLQAIKGLLFGSVGPSQRSNQRWNCRTKSRDLLAEPLVTGLLYKYRYRLSWRERTWSWRDSRCANAASYCFASHVSLLSCEPPSMLLTTRQSLNNI